METTKSTINTKKVEPFKKGEKISKEDNARIKKILAETSIISSDIDKIQSKLIKNYQLDDRTIKDAVKLFYQIQDCRIATGNAAYAEVATQLVKMKIPDEEVNKPLLLIRERDNLLKQEDMIVKFLTEYVERHPIAPWLLSIRGIGPVLAAGLIAYIDIERCETAGTIWKYAGITGNPEIDTRKKGEKLKYNPDLKKLCWKIGSSFTKVYKEEFADEPESIYAVLYRQKFDEISKKNENGDYKESAKEYVKLYKKDSATKRCYASGKLPKAHIMARARRFAVKIFLSHLFEVWYELDRGYPAPKPFVQQHMGHVHIMSAPNKHLVLGTTCKETKIVPKHDENFLDDFYEKETKPNKSSKKRFSINQMTAADWKNVSTWIDQGQSTKQISLNLKCSYPTAQKIVKVVKEG